MSDQDWADERCMLLLLATHVTLGPGLGFSPCMCFHMWLWNFQRFGIMLGLPFPGDKMNQNCRLGFLFTLVVFICLLAIRVFSQKENRAPCFREQVCKEPYLWHPEPSMFPKEGLMVGKVVSSWDSAAVTGYGTVFRVSADFFLGLTFP